MKQLSLEVEPPACKRCRYFSYVGHYDAHCEVLDQLISRYRPPCSAYEFHE